MKITRLRHLDHAARRSGVLAEERCGPTLTSLRSFHPRNQLLAWAVLVGAMCGSIPAPARAQSCGSPTYGGESGILLSLAGRVTDIETGKGIPGINVVARSGQLVFTATTNSWGNYAVQGVPPGKYALRFSRKVVYPYEPNPFPDFNYSPEPLIVDTNPYSPNSPQKTAQNSSAQKYLLTHCFFLRQSSQVANFTVENTRRMP
jgi:hypothetical protein